MNPLPVRMFLSLYVKKSPGYLSDFLVLFTFICCPVLNIYSYLVCILNSSSYYLHIHTCTRENKWKGKRKTNKETTKITTKLWNRDVTMENQFEIPRWKVATQYSQPYVRATNTIISEQLAHNNRWHSFLSFARHSIFIDLSLSFSIPLKNLKRSKWKGAFIKCIARSQVNFIW